MIKRLWLGTSERGLLVLVKGVHVFSAVPEHEEVREDLVGLVHFPRLQHLRDDFGQLIEFFPHFP
jgi:hypothetical protein